tara:strand:- start:348 stop:641 length:294 start_codon:yes stop_codon:yes gene_type:complete
MNDISETLKDNRENKKRLTINQALDYLFKVKDIIKKDSKKLNLLEKHIKELKENKFNLGGRTFLSITNTLLIIEAIMFCEGKSDMCITKKTLLYEKK